MKTDIKNISEFPIVLRVEDVDWMDTWMKEYMKPKLRPTTYESYECFTRIHIKPVVGDMLLRDLRHENLQKLYNDKFESGRHDGEGGLFKVSQVYSFEMGCSKIAVKMRGSKILQPRNPSFTW